MAAGKVARRPILQASAIGIGTFWLAGCIGADTGEEDLAPELDLDTLQAETPDGTVQAEPWENTYVGAVDDKLYIGVSLSEGADTESPQEARVYLCDSQGLSVRGIGNIGPEPTTLEREELSVELWLADGTVSGAVTVRDEEPRPFTATEASGVAGVYVAEDTLDDTNYWIGWIVLSDGSQRGEWEDRGGFEPF